MAQTAEYLVNYNSRQENEKRPHIGEAGVIIKINQFSFLFQSTNGYSLPVFGFLSVRGRLNRDEISLNLQALVSLVSMFLKPARGRGFEFI